MKKDNEFKQPLEYSAGELDQLKGRQLRFHVGTMHSPQVLEVVQGEIHRIRLASNPPNLPTDVEIQINGLQKRWFSLFEIKRIEK